MIFCSTAVQSIDRHLRRSELSVLASAGRGARAAHAPEEERGLHVHRLVEALAGDARVSAQPVQRGVHHHNNTILERAEQHGGQWAARHHEPASAEEASGRRRCVRDLRLGAKGGWREGSLEMVGENISRVALDLYVAALARREDVDLARPDEREAFSMPCVLLFIGE